MFFLRNSTTPSPPPAGFGGGAVTEMRVAAGVSFGSESLFSLLESSSLGVREWTAEDGPATVKAS